jgi:cobalt-zinc-cadmium efflux system protein
LLLVVAGWVVFEAMQRLDDPADVSGAGLLVVALLGLIVNLGSAVLLSRRSGDSLNMHGATLHMMSDAAGSVAAVIAGVAVAVWDAPRADPIASMVIAVLVLWSGWSLLRSTVHVLLEGTPRGMVPSEIEAAIAEDDAVESVHHLHTWNIASDVPALSAHVVLAELRTDRGFTLHEVQERSKGIFKASALSGYERGERSISLERFRELTAFYSVAADAALTEILALRGEEAPGARAIDVTEDTIDLTDTREVVAHQQH